MEQLGNKSLLPDFADMYLCILVEYWEIYVLRGTKYTRGQLNEANYYLGKSLNDAKN